MGSIRTNAAAAMLGVSPNTLRSWERRFGFPEPRRTAGRAPTVRADGDRGAALGLRGDPQHLVGDRDRAERGNGPASPARLRSAINRFDECEADRVLEESLAVRSVERTVEEVLLPGVEALEESGDGTSAEFGFAWRWATTWLAAATRVAPPATRSEAVVLFDASGTCDLDSLHAQALELALRRRGLRTLTLAVTTDSDRLAHALNAVEPKAVVLTGHTASLDTLSRLVYAARRHAAEGVTIFDYRGALPSASATTVPRLGDTPLAARDRLLAVLDDPAGARRATPALRAVSGA